MKCLAPVKSTNTNRLTILLCLGTQLLTVTLHCASRSPYGQHDLNVKLHNAAMDNCKNQAKQALAQGAESKSVDVYHYTALHKAASCLNPRMVKYLLHHEVDINAQDVWGNTAAHLAIGIPSKQRSQKDVVCIMKLLIKSGIDLTIRNRLNDRTVLDKARHNRQGGHDNLALIGILSNATKKQMERQKALMEHQKALDRQLEAAAMLGDCQSAHNAITKGANINSANPILHRTPLHWATVYFELNMVEYLLAAKANVDAQDYLGLTALHTIISKPSWLYPKAPRAQTLKTLIQAYPNLAIKDCHGLTALQCAEFEQSGGYDNSDLIEILQNAEKEQRERKTQIDE